MSLEGIDPGLEKKRAALASAFDGAYQKVKGLSKEALLRVIAEGEKRLNANQKILDGRDDFFNAEYQRISDELELRAAKLKGAKSQLADRERAEAAQASTSNKKEDFSVELTDKQISSAKNDDKGSRVNADSSLSRHTQSPRELLDFQIEKLENVSVNDFLKKLEGSDFKGGSLTPEILKEEGLLPKYKIRIGDSVVWFSSSGYRLGEGRLAVVAYVEGQGKMMARSYYRSNSQGVWRYLPDYGTNSEGSINRYGKGFGEESVTLPIAIQKALAEITGENMLVLETKRDPMFIFTATVSKKGVNNSEYYREVEDSPRKLKGDFYAEGGKTPPEQIRLSKEQSPDFSKLLTSWKQNTDVYGQVSTEVFPSRDGLLKFMFCRDAKGRAWIGGIENDSEMQSTGLKKSWISGGDLATPAFEYSSQKGDQTGGYGNDDFRSGVYVDMYKNYLSKIPVIQEYLRYVSGSVAQGSIESGARRKDASVESANAPLDAILDRIKAEGKFSNKDRSNLLNRLYKCYRYLEAATAKGERLHEIEKNLKYWREEIQKTLAGLPEQKQESFLQELDPYIRREHMTDDQLQKEYHITPAVLGRDKVKSAQNVSSNQPVVANKAQTGENDKNMPHESAPIPNPAEATSPTPESQQAKTPKVENQDEERPTLESLNLPESVKRRIQKGIKTNREFRGKIVARAGGDVAKMSEEDRREYDEALEYAGTTILRAIQESHVNNKRIERIPQEYRDQLMGFDLPPEPRKKNPLTNKEFEEREAAFHGRSRSEDEREDFREPQPKTSGATGGAIGGVVDAVKSDLPGGSRASEQKNGSKKEKAAAPQEAATEEVHEEEEGVPDRLSKARAARRRRNEQVQEASTETKTEEPLTVENAYDSREFVNFLAAYGETGAPTDEQIEQYLKLFNLHQTTASELADVFITPEKGGLLDVDASFGKEVEQAIRAYLMEQTFDAGELNVLRAHTTSLREFPERIAAKEQELAELGGVSRFKQAHDTFLQLQKQRKNLEAQYGKGPLKVFFGRLFTRGLEYAREGFKEAKEAGEKLASPGMKTVIEALDSGVLKNLEKNIQTVEQAEADKKKWTALFDAARGEIFEHLGGMAGVVEMLQQRAKKKFQEMVSGEQDVVALQKSFDVLSGTRERIAKQGAAYIESADIEQAMQDVQDLIDYEFEQQVEKALDKDLKQDKPLSALRAMLAQFARLEKLGSKHSGEVRKFFNSTVAAYLKEHEADISPSKRIILHKLMTDQFHTSEVVKEAADNKVKKEAKAESKKEEAEEEGTASEVVKEEATEPEVAPEPAHAEAASEHVEKLPAVPRVGERLKLMMKYRGDSDFAMHTITVRKFKHGMSQPNAKDKIHFLDESAGGQSRRVVSSWITFEQYQKIKERTEKGHA